MLTTVELTRKELYEEIWKISATGAAKKHGIPYAKCLAQIKAAKIPIPPSGYWTKINYGKPVEQAPLQGNEDDVVALPAEELRQYHTAEAKESEEPPLPVSSQEGTARSLSDTVSFAEPAAQKPLGDDASKPTDIPPEKVQQFGQTYFFIIDEINWGNLSKIFGELFMLIESDKRGVELPLLYADERFFIPSNIYIIGMMNTRSLAMLDYALRRRFAFFKMPPAFSSAGFQAYKAKINNIKFNRLVEAVERLNREIAEDDSLDEGFRIGHSYFCTNINIRDEWLRSVVEFELIPLLKEYWFDEPAKVKDWSHVLREAVK